MKTIGLVGGIASGKSLVAEILVELGAGLLDADRAGHAVLADDADVHAALRERWGDAVFTADGGIDRAAVARRVFAPGDAAELERRFLEGLLHPRIRQRLDRFREHFLAAGKPAVVLDAPLLLEAGWAPLCDVVLMVDSPRELRRNRARRRGWSDDEFDRREQTQWPVEEKRRAADVIVENAGSENELYKLVGDFWQNYVLAGRDT